MIFTRIVYNKGFELETRIIFRDDHNPLLDTTILVEETLRILYYIQSL
jgi:hypothetical protein